MIIWETVNGKIQPKVFCDCCGWECQGDDYEEIDSMIICQNCVRKNVKQELIIERE